jgi:hypothetical protein
MSEFGSFRFGWDGINRISTSTLVYQEQTELLPDSTLYSPIPFVPPTVDGSDSNSDTQLSEDGHRIWTQTPAAVDLIFWQGDDIVIPFYFNDPAVLSDDMALNYAWFAQIRRWHSYRSTFVNDFATHAVYHPPAAPPTQTDEYTMVELFLPRSDNIYSGCFRWELYSIALEDWSRFPAPDNVEPEDWPPPDQLRTWLWGRCYIVPRVSATDMLPVGQIPPLDGGNQPAAITAQGWVVGPNGRVP